jgi:sirohydrochlorin cobaltochelatase
MNKTKKGVVLIGHGGVPTDFPRDLFKKWMDLHKSRKADQPPTQVEQDLENTLRDWPRTPDNDPYQFGLESLGRQLKDQLKECQLVTAYNEFCRPTIAHAVEELIESGIINIVLLTTMVTPGGSHAEKEIPEEVQKLKAKYPYIEINYAWPFDLSRVAGMMKEQIEAVQV